ncbi:transcription factor bHLH113-like isoform X3 [Malus sylvestris]|uniref:transcription factor bHLH113-like isoform X3 n=1 Tax=Malus sylvestris TaxID=3752 RepID=UPI0021ACD51D|nr:transcription factor bHLH113-like isoform X3 [Malus sylvestris]XP_050149395.1 transcription factor bHLH113-like isoform X3 [Malus sylvestris]
MAESGGFEGDHLAVTEGTSFSQLLFAADEVVNLAVNSDQTFNYTCSSTYPTEIKPPKMLCFGNYDHQTDVNGVEIGFSETAKKSAVTCSGSSSVSSTSTASISALPKSNNKRRNGLAPISNTTTPTTQRATKKTKSENRTSAGNGKRKEKLGERITALQQLVSPYGKTDTASVLHEAMGYIRFLQQQVQVLCSPYLQRLEPPSLPVHNENHFPKYQFV